MVSSGISIVLCLICTRGGDLGVLCVLYCGVLCLVCIVLLPVVLCTVPWCTLMCGVLCCVLLQVSVLWELAGLCSAGR